MESDLEKGIVAFGELEGMEDDVVAITGIMLDVSEADSGPITVTLDLESAEEDLALLIGSDTGDRHCRNPPRSQSHRKNGHHKDPGRGSYSHGHN